MKTVRISDAHNRQEHVIMVDKIVRLSKSDHGYTCVHLVNGETMCSADSINTVEARINQTGE